MPAHIIPLDQFKDQILEWRAAKKNLKEIIHLLKEYYNFECKIRTIERRLQLWDSKVYILVKETPALRLEIAALFQFQFDDATILRILQQKGYQIGLTSLVRIRLSLGLRRRLSIWERDEANEQLWGIVQAELDKGEIEGYGIRLLYTWFRTKGYDVARYNIKSF